MGFSSIIKDEGGDSEEKLINKTVLSLAGPRSMKGC